MPFTKVAATIQYYYRAAAAVVDLAHTIIHIYDLFFFGSNTNPPLFYLYILLKIIRWWWWRGRYREIKKKKNTWECLIGMLCSLLYYISHDSG